MTHSQNVPAGDPTVGRKRRLTGLFAVGVTSAVLTLLALLTLPHDKYIRWQSLKTEAYARLGWTYERIHFDDTPIDIAFIGTSHTMNGVDAERVEHALADSGVRTPDGRCYTAVNFAIPSYGRNLHAVIAEELLRSRRVKLLVLEVFENETRKAHPAFVHVASLREVMGAPWLVNLNYLADISRLPFRQLTLWAETLAPNEFGMKASFDKREYDGSTVDNTRVVNVGGVALTPPRNTMAPLADLEEAARELRNTKNLHMLGQGLSSLEYRYPMHYLNLILEEARKKDTLVTFLYLPQYGAPPKPFSMSPYDGRGDWIYAQDVLEQPGLWHDPAHLNAQGAALISERVAGALRSRLPRGPKTKTPCNFGYPSRQLGATNLKPLSK